MWVQIAAWMFHDEEVDILHTGQIVDMLGLRLEVYDFISHVSPNGLRDSVSIIGDGLPFRYQVQATIELPSERRPHSEWRPVGFTDYLGSGSFGPFIVRIPSEITVPTGRQVQLAGSFGAIGEYEFDDFGIFDVRRSWRVLGLKFRSRQPADTHISNRGATPDHPRSKTVDMDAIDLACEQASTAASYFADLVPHDA